MIVAVAIAVLFALKALQSEFAPAAAPSAPGARGSDAGNEFHEKLLKPSERWDDLIDDAPPTFGRGESCSTDFVCIH